MFLIQARYNPVKYLWSWQALPKFILRDRLTCDAYHIRKRCYAQAQALSRLP